MSRNLSSNELQQQNDRLLKSEEDKVNNLIERLESQKKKLTPDKHPIIDWGVGFLRSKAMEEKKTQTLIAQESAQFKTKVLSIMNSYQNVDNLDDDVEDKSYMQSCKILRDIADKAYRYKDKNMIESEVNFFKVNLSERYPSGIYDESYQGMIDNLSISIKELKQYPDIDLEFAEYLTKIICCLEYPTT